MPEAPSESDHEETVADAASGSRLARLLRLIRSTTWRWVMRAIYLFLIFLAILATFVLTRAFAARGLPDLSPWHRDAPEGEFRTRIFDSTPTLASYLEREDRLFVQLDQFAIAESEAAVHTQYSRYLQGGPGDPETFEQNWNRTTERVPQTVRGGVLLLHGCSDGPYHLRHVAEVFHRQGYRTLCLRLPGHGTVPAGLKNARWRDWYAAARVGAAHVTGQLADDQPFYVCGFSMGGALTLTLAMDSLEEDDLRTPDRIFLFSSSVGITAFARLSLADQSLSFMPYFEKSAWMSIQPEFDPFKYNSFPKRAGYETWKLTRRNTGRWRQLAVDGSISRFPPVTAFQSGIDSTVLNTDILAFFSVLPDNGSELIVFDVNHAPGLDGFFRQRLDVLTAPLSSTTPHNYDLTVVTNADDRSLNVAANRRAARSLEVTNTPLELTWPATVISLSHSAIPIAMDDPIYGDGSGSGGSNRLVIGAIIIRGERGALTISPADLTRIRFNPFFPYVEQRIEEAIAGES